MKWRDYDPQQYCNWRAYLDFGGGQVTDLFTHWIDVVHMFMGQDIPIAAVAAGGVYHYKDGRTAPDTINVLLEYPARIHRDVRSHARPRHHGAAIEMCGTKGRLYIDRGRYEFTPRWAGARKPVDVKAGDDDVDRRSRQELPRLRASRGSAQWRRPDRPSLRPGLPPRQHRLRAEAAHRFRPGARRDSAVLAGAIAPVILEFL